MSSFSCLHIILACDLIRCECWKLIFIKSAEEGGIELSALCTGLKRIGTEFSGASKEVTFLFSEFTKFLSWVTEAIHHLPFSLRAMVQLVYAICNTYCISAGFTEGQAAGKAWAPSAPFLNPMQDLFLPPPSHWNTMFLSCAPSVAHPDSSYLNLSYQSQLPRLPRAWKLYSGVTCHLIVISLHMKPCENREETYLPFFLFHIVCSLLL